MLRFIPTSLLPMYGAAFLFSMVINLLSLFSMWHFLLIIDRVIPGRNEATLVVITVLVLAALGMMSVMEGVRSRLLTRISNRLEGLMAGPVVRAMLVRAGDADYDQGAADLQKIKTFLGGPGIVAFFDLPWLPLFLAVNYLLHPLLGLVSTIGAGVLLILLLVNQILTGRSVAEYSGSTSRSDTLLEVAGRHVHAIYAMGMLPAVVSRWKQAGAADLALETRVHQRVGAATALNKSVGMALRVVILSFGAMLVIHNEITFGMMIVASMIMGKALSPLSEMLGGWKRFQEARQASARLRAALVRADMQAGARDSAPRPLPQALPGLEVRSLCLDFDGAMVLDNVSFTAAPGTILAVVGPGGAGKSTLLRTIAGLHQPGSGSATLDGVDLAALSDNDLRAKALGYLPQDVELQAVTVAENIGRLRTDDSEAVIQAARMAGAHEMIMRLPKGYDTPIQPKAANLSAGQRQRIALARALYGNPRLILLDEPDANLDQDGRNHLSQALTKLKDQGSIILIVSHQPWITSLRDQELALG
ncbi:MAG: ATP-binding cassette domain-containing protein [Desulfovibrionales bacterium]|nr:MAG: ATP-binding cassette domain-containing protein [Desulfovibrionales bacterium]